MYTKSPLYNKVVIIEFSIFKIHEKTHNSSPLSQLYWPYSIRQRTIFQFPQERLIEVINDKPQGTQQTGPQDPRPPQTPRPLISQTVLLTAQSALKEHDHGRRLIPSLRGASDVDIVAFEEERVQGH